MLALFVCTACTDAPQVVPSARTDAFVDPPPARADLTGVDLIDASPGADLGGTDDADLATAVNDLTVPIDVAVTPQATRLVLATEAQNAASGAMLPEIVVEVRDDLGNRVENATGTIEVALLDGSPGAILGGSASIPIVAGLASFSDLHVDRLGRGYRLQFTASGLASATSAPFDIGGSRLVFRVQPSSFFPSGGVVVPEVAAVDELGSVDPLATQLVTLALDGGQDPLAQAPLVSGVARFAPFPILPTGAHTLTATAAALGSATSGNMLVRYSRVHFLTQPTTVTDVGLFDPPVEVEFVGELGDRDVAVDANSYFVASFGPTFSEQIIFGDYYPGPDNTVEAGLATIRRGPRRLGTARQIRFDYMLEASALFDVIPGPPAALQPHHDVVGRNRPVRLGAALITPYNYAIDNSVAVTLAPTSVGPLTEETSLTVDGVARFGPYVFAASGDYPFELRSPGLPTYAGTLKVRDWGRIAAPAGVGTGSVAFLAADSLTGDHIFAAASRGVDAVLLRSDDGGLTTTTSLVAYVEAAAIAPSDPLVGYAIEAFASPYPDLRVWQTVDGGVTWSPRFEGALQGGSPRSISVSPLDPLDLIVESEQLYRSTDGGLTFHVMLSETGRLGVARSPSAPNVMYAAVRTRPWNYTTPRKVPIMKSVDGGTTWSVINNNLTEYQIGSLCVDATNPDRLYVSITGGRRRSDDGGNTFAPIGPVVAGSSGWTISCHPTTPGLVFAGNQRSWDAGQTWETWTDDSLYGEVSFIVHGKPNVMFASYGMMTVLGVP